jgi:hypothetical protein
MKVTQMIKIGKLNEQSTPLLLCKQTFQRLCNYL